MKNNVVSINSRRRHHFLKSSFYSHNRKNSFEEIFHFTGGLIALLGIPVLAFSFLSYEIIFLILIAALIGAFKSKYFPYKVETYFTKENLPEISAENVQRRRAS